MEIDTLSAVDALSMPEFSIIEILYVCGFQSEIIG